MKERQEIAMERKEFALDLIDFIHKAPDQFNAVANMADMLSNEGFIELDKKERWKVDVGGKYYFKVNSSALIAFTVDTEDVVNRGFRIIATHCDAPCLKIKPNPEMKKENEYLVLNTEGYGGSIRSTWLDRPLGISGRIILKSKDAFKPEERIIDFKKPLCIIPNEAIHLNREMNKGIEYNMQKDMLAFTNLCGESCDPKGYLDFLITEEFDIKAEDILDYELYLYDFQKGTIIGADENFISAPKLDNLAMCHAAINALMDSDYSTGVSIVAVFDNEEVGSSTMQGADSNMLRKTLERVSIAMGFSREDFIISLENSFIISADAAHAVHPCHLDSHDPTNRPVLGGGPVIKTSADKSYATDSFTSAVFKNLCKKAKVECQEFVNRSDKKGGTTIGPLASKHLGIRTVDAGTPILGMHSVRELGNTYDHLAMYKVFREFFELKYR